MRKKFGLAAAFVLVSAALATRVEASACTVACASQEHACINSCAGDSTCVGNCVDQWNACMGNVCHIYI